ncbi:pectinesterase family protein [Hirschia baltica]|uniref:Pectinesterase n=1 Tax=Hirschia baltica (strain ATCC 49814 / DSM 5838 / IFAM 1418) TaxID=582402 RepID=C6XPN2_HIRBI|nr:pectinesterase family protein [Hirschia baltica]ACT60297.1 Pectinesterase [Hirschia baltica ATCC 49814]
MPTSRLLASFPLVGALLAACQSTNLPEAQSLEFSVQETCEATPNCFTNIQDALNAASALNSSDWKTVSVAAGDYYEKLTIRDAKTRLIGEGIETTRIHYDAVAETAGKFHRQNWGTAGSATITVDAEDVHIEGFKIENTFDYISNDKLDNDDPKRISNSQAAALLLDIHSDKVYLNKVTLEGYQDTVFANGKRAFISNSFISGNVDFIFGNGQLLIEDSEIQSRRRGQDFEAGEVQSFIAAPSTQISDRMGIVFHTCRLTPEEGLPNHSITLGRPWHPTTRFPDGRYADPNAIGQAIYINTFMDSHIHPDHWSTMNGTARNGEKTDVFHPEDSRFHEVGSYGPGAKTSFKGTSYTDFPDMAEINTIMFDDWNEFKNRLDE